MVFCLCYSKISLKNIFAFLSFLKKFKMFK
jgi:hypothetical protein